MDIATLVGLIVGFGLVAMAILMGGSAAAFFNAPSVLIVVAGTFAITTVAFSLKEIITAQSVMLKTLLFSLPDVVEESKKLIELAQKARANGLLSIQGDVEQIEDAFLKSGLTQVVDGANPEAVEDVLNSDIANMMQRHQLGIKVLKKAAEIAPAMGLIGTLIGLVQMLGNLEDPSAIGPAMAVALLTTMYGAILANMVFMPMSGKLERNDEEEVLLRKVYVTAILSIARQENPRQLEMLINTQLPPAKRISMFD